MSMFEDEEDRQFDYTYNLQGIFTTNPLKILKV
jgi:hypothetical protein